jgi:electron transport complex protein RnfD
MSDIHTLPSPHSRTRDKVERIMLYVIIALTPSTVLGVYFFGLRALLIILISIASALIFEAVYQLINKKPVTIFDLSAVLTGLLLALTLPPAIPLWMPIIGSFVAIVLVKQLFGGLGQNFLNPALAGRGFLAVAFAAPMAGGFIRPLSGFFEVDATAAPTPITTFVHAGLSPTTDDYIMALFGNVAGSIGETATIALIIGGLFLLVTKIISWHIPVSFIATVYILTFLLGEYALYQLLIGALFLGAFFMATDYATSPMSPLGKIIFGIGCGVFTVLIRLYGGYPEGVAFAILLMNLTVPLIDRYIRPRVFGTRRKKKNEN